MRNFINLLLSGLSAAALIGPGMTSGTLLAYVVESKLNDLKG